MNLLYFFLKKLYIHSGVIEFGKLHHVLGVDLDDAEVFLDTFASMDTRREGKVRIEGFLKYLHLPLVPLTQKLFDLYDVVSYIYI